MHTHACNNSYDCSYTFTGPSIILQLIATRTQTGIWSLWVLTLVFTLVITTAFIDICIFARQCLTVLYLIFSYSYVASYLVNMYFQSILEHIYMCLEICNNRHKEESLDKISTIRSINIFRTINAHKYWNCLFWYIIASYVFSQRNIRSNPVLWTVQQ